MIETICGTETGVKPGTPLAALIAFYRAFNNRDLAGVMDNWLAGEAISMSNPLGGIKRGREQLAAVYARIFEGPLRVRVEFHDFTVAATNRVFCAVGRERGWCRSKDRVITLAIRTTRVFQRHGEHWRQIHHHGSIDDPELLRAYQSAAGINRGPGGA